MRKTIINKSHEVDLSNIPNFLLKHERPIEERYQEIEKENQQLKKVMSKLLKDFGTEDFDKGFWTSVDEARELINPKRNEIEIKQVKEINVR